MKTAQIQHNAKKDLIDLLVSIYEIVETNGTINKKSVIISGVEMALKNEIESKVLIYDNGGKTFDRYTIFLSTGEVFGMNTNGKEFNLFLGYENEFTDREHLGKKLESIPNELFFAVLQRIKFEL